MTWTPETLSGWGRSTYSRCDVASPTSANEIAELLRTSADIPVLARGGGRSYGDAALNRDGRVLSMHRLKAIHAFDSATGDIVVDCGVTFGDLLARYAAEGWIPPVTPGTQFVTIGGALANDVHGKNHDFDGSFGDHVLWFDLVGPDGSEQRVSPASVPQLFAATIGGIGLTGVATRIAFRMKRVPSTTMRVHERRVAHLTEYLDLLEEARSKFRYSVGWIDGIAKGNRLGRGILETAEHVDTASTRGGRRTLRIPMDMPSSTINTLTARAFNALYYHRIPARGRDRMLDLERFFYPLDSILDWNRLYGRAGFVQFQCVIPDSHTRETLPRILQRIASSGRASFLAVIKTLGGNGRGYLSFPMKGVTLALDFPRRSGVAALLASLHDMVVDCGGRTYLAKDACLTPQQFRSMYPNLPAMQKVLQSSGAARRIRSDMASRLNI